MKIFDMKSAKHVVVFSSLLVLGIGLLFNGCRKSKTEETKSSSSSLSNTRFTNPIMENGADPWVYKHSDGYYYYMATRGDRLTLWRSRSLPNIADGEQKTVWTPPENGPNSSNIWAPEIHFLDGKFYIYYTAVDQEEPTDANRMVFVLENSSANPLEGPWVDKGPVKTDYSGLDGSVFEFGDTRYFLYSAYKDGKSVLNISRMKNPWTLEGEEAILASPTYEWEKYENRAICEAPQFLRGKQGKLTIVYSASACWDDYYALGMLVASDTSDIMNPESWRKLPEPVFQTSEANSVYGPGHCSFTTSADGSNWIVYHAKREANSACRGRSTRIQPFIYNDEGLPDFGKPASLNRGFKISEEGE